MKYKEEEIHALTVNMDIPSSEQIGNRALNVIQCLLEICNKVGQRTPLGRWEANDIRAEVPTQTVHDFEHFLVSWHFENHFCLEQLERMMAMGWQVSFPQTRAV